MRLSGRGGSATSKLASALPSPRCACRAPRVREPCRCARAWPPTPASPWSRCACGSGSQRVALCPVRASCGLIGSPRTLARVVGPVLWGSPRAASRNPPGVAGVALSQSDPAPARPGFPWPRGQAPPPRWRSWQCRDVRCRCRCCCCCCANGVQVYETIDKLQEVNPMLGFRGCRLGITYPEITEMQVRSAWLTPSLLFPWAMWKRVASPTTTTTGACLRPLARHCPARPALGRACVCLWREGAGGSSRRWRALAVAGRAALPPPRARGLNGATARPEDAARCAGARHL